MTSPTLEDSREAAMELVGVTSAFLRWAKRTPDGGAVVEFGPETFALLVETFNRATLGKPYDIEAAS